MFNRKDNRQGFVTSSGFSLFETLIATLLSSVVGLLALSLLLYMSHRSNSVRSSADIDANIRMAASAIAAYVEPAVRTNWAFNTISTNIKADERGQLLNGFKSTIGTGPNHPILLGAFLREAGKPRNGMARGDLRATAIFFQNPTPAKEGVLSIVTSSSGTGAVELSEAGAAHRFGQLVELKLRPTPGSVNSKCSVPIVGPEPGCSPNNAVRVAEFRMIFRKFLEPDKSKWRWCPPDEMDTAPCSTDATYRDIERVVQVRLLNNTIVTNRKTTIDDDGNNVPDLDPVTGEFKLREASESLYGDLYFFDLMMGKNDE